MSRAGLQCARRRLQRWIGAANAMRLMWYDSGDGRFGLMPVEHISGTWGRRDWPDLVCGGLVLAFAVRLNCLFLGIVVSGYTKLSGCAHGLFIACTLHHFDNMSETCGLFLAAVHYQDIFPGSTTFRGGIVGVVNRLCEFGTLRGCCLAVAYNYVGHVRGFSGALGHNRCELVQGVQLGAVNSCSGDFIHRGDHRAVQVGVVNACAMQHNTGEKRPWSVQVGLVNSCEDRNEPVFKWGRPPGPHYIRVRPWSLQFGAVNRCGENGRCIQVGLVNWRRGARMPMPLVAVRWRTAE